MNIHFSWGHTVIYRASRVNLKLTNLWLILKINLFNDKLFFKQWMIFNIMRKIYKNCEVCFKAEKFVGELQENSFAQLTDFF